MQYARTVSMARAISTIIDSFAQFIVLAFFRFLMIAFTGSAKENRIWKHKLKSQEMPDDHLTGPLVWTQLWSFADVSQQGVEFNKKISKIKIIFWFDFHRCSHGPSKIGHHFRKQSGSKIEVFKKWQ